MKIPKNSEIVGIVVQSCFYKNTEIPDTPILNPLRMKNPRLASGEIQNRYSQFYICEYVILIITHKLYREGLISQRQNGSTCPIIVGEAQSRSIQ